MLSRLVVVLVVVIMAAAAAEDVIGDHQLVALVQEAGIIINPPGAEIQVRIVDAADHVPLEVGAVIRARVDIIEYEAFWQHAAGKVYPMVLSRTYDHDPWTAGQPGEEVVLEDLPPATPIDSEQQRRQTIAQVLEEAGVPSSSERSSAVAGRGTYRPGLGERQVLLDELATITQELEALEGEVASVQDRRQRAVLLDELETITAALESLQALSPGFDTRLQTMVEEAAAALEDHPEAQSLIDDLRGLAALDGVRADTALPSLERLRRRAEHDREPFTETERITPLVDPVQEPVTEEAVVAVRRSVIRIIDVGATWLVLYQGRLGPGQAVTEDGHALIIEAVDGRFAVVRADVPVVIDQRLAVVQTYEAQTP